MGNTIKTPHFGSIDFKDQEVIHFPKGIPGFYELTRFLLIDSQDYQPFKFLQSVDEPTISLPLLSPLVVKPDYELNLSDQQRCVLGLEESKKVLVYCVVTLNRDPAGSTANLVSPVVINPEKQVAAQLTITEGGYAVAEPLLKES